MPLIFPGEPHSFNTPLGATLKNSVEISRSTWASGRWGDNTSPRGVSCLVGWGLAALGPTLVKGDWDICVAGTFRNRLDVPSYPLP